MRIVSIVVGIVGLVATAGAAAALVPSPARTVEGDDDAFEPEVTDGEDLRRVRLVTEGVAFDSGGSTPAAIFLAARPARPREAVGLGLPATVDDDVVSAPGVFREFLTPQPDPHLWSRTFGRWAVDADASALPDRIVRDLLFTRPTDRIYDLNAWAVAFDGEADSARYPSVLAIDSAERHRSSLHAIVEFIDGIPAATFSEDVAIGQVDWKGLVRLRASDDDVARFESLLDARFFTGGRSVPMEVVLIADPTEVGRRTGFAPPMPGEVTRVRAGVARDAIRRASDDAPFVSLDTPEDRPVTACAGPARVYVADYDVEISMASNIAAPVFAVAQEGLCVRAQAQRDIHGSVSLELRACALVLASPIPTFSTSLASGPVTASAPVVIQIPKSAEPCSTFDGSISLGADAAIVGLSDGRALVIAPTRIAGEVDRARAWRYYVAKDAEALADTDRWHVDVRPLEGAGPSARGFDADFDVVTREVAVPGARGVGEQLVRSADARIVPGPVADVRRVDVVVTLARPLDPIEPEVPIVGLSEPIKFARAERAVVPLRFLLRRFEEATREITVNLGSGPERWAVSVLRCPK